MKQVPLNQVKNDLSRFLRMAVQENIIITRHGVPAGMLIGFESDNADWWEDLLLEHPRFQARIAQARESLNAGKGVSLEVMREEYGTKPRRRRQTVGRAGKK
jgi:prevent-host-death family protein